MLEITMTFSNDVNDFGSKWHTAVCFLWSCSFFTQSNTVV